MTQEEKLRKAERLFDEIGLIDDRFVAEAETAYTPKRSLAWLRTVIIVAAALTLALSLLVGSFAVAMISKLIADKLIDTNDGAPGGTTEEFNDQSSTGGVLSLYQRLDGLKDTSDIPPVPHDEIDLFDGNVSVVVKYADSEDYYVYRCSDDKANTLLKKLSEDKGQRVSGTDNKSVDGVWIALGDGRVISPCLEQTSGNVGYGEIFEYEPEYEPTVEFSDYLCDVIS